MLNEKEDVIVIEHSSVIGGCFELKRLPMLSFNCKVNVRTYYNKICSVVRGLSARQEVCTSQSD